MKYLPTSYHLRLCIEDAKQVLHTNYEKKLQLYKLVKTILCLLQLMKFSKA